MSLEQIFAKHLITPPSQSNYHRNLAEMNVKNNKITQLVRAKQLKKRRTPTSRPPLTTQPPQTSLSGQFQRSNKFANLQLKSLQAGSSNLLAANSGTRTKDPLLPSSMSPAPLIDQVQQHQVMPEKQ